MKDVEYPPHLHKNWSKAEHISNTGEIGLHLQSLAPVKQVELVLRTGRISTKDR